MKVYLVTYVEEERINEDRGVLREIQEVVRAKDSTDAYFANWYNGRRVVSVLEIR